MRPARILLVDDEASILRAVTPLLRSRGYEVEAVGTGGEALRSVGAEPPDLIVLDLGLPDIDGTEVCRRIRAESPLPVSSAPVAPAPIPGGREGSHPSST